MRRLRLWLSVCGLLILAAGVSVGVLVGSHLRRPSLGSGPFLPELSAHLRDSIASQQEVWEELELDDSQRQNLKVLFSKHYQRVETLRADLVRLSHEVHAAVSGVLTPEQRRRLDEIKERYAETRVEDTVIRELAFLRERVGLFPGQEPIVWTVLYKAVVERREAIHEHHELCRENNKQPDRAVIREKMREVSDRRDDRLARVFDDEQLAKYRSLLEERRSWKTKKRQRDERPSPPEDKGSPAPD